MSGLQRLEAMRASLLADAERMERSNTVDMLNAPTARERARTLEVVIAELIANPPAAAPDEAMVRDAMRWRAVVGCARVRVLGSAGLRTVNDPYGNPHGDYAHIGLELWTKHEAGSHPEALADFTRFADKAAALAAALTGAAK